MEAPLFSGAASEADSTAAEEVSADSVGLEEEVSGVEAPVEAGNLSRTIKTQNKR